MATNLWKLSHMGLERTIPDFFEHAWKARTGVNPVWVAMSIEANRERKFIQRACLVTLVCAVVAFIAMVGLAAEVQTETLKHWILYISSAAAFLGILWFLLLLISSHSWEECEEEEIQSAKEFWEDLVKVFCDWVPEGHSYTGGYWHLVFQDFNHADGEKKAREYAKGVMTREAEAVVAREMTNVEISTRYDTLLRLGLVRPGGYGRYIKEAEKAQPMSAKSQAA